MQTPYRNLDLRQLMRRKGVSLRKSGINYTYAWHLQQGHHLIGTEALPKLAQTLGEPPEVVYGASEVSVRRALKAAAELLAAKKSKSATRKKNVARYVR